MKLKKTTFSQHLLTFIVFMLLNTIGFSQNVEKKVVLQGFWWNFAHDDYIPHWSNYLADLAPRLKAMGIDAVWIPPSIKNDFNPASVGYAPFDHYDLGDKFQKSQKETRMGNKDELLRMIAILHANGIEVIQDIVPNHVIGAGDQCSEGEDPAAPGDQFKNFRYVSFATPADDCTTDYLTRTGRWPKNHQNFHPNPDHNTNADDITAQLFGPDVCFFDGAFGLSSNAVFNPNQSSYSPYNNGGTSNGNGYMRKHMREWLIWYKKQTGFDGVRVDAVKHFPTFAAEDFLANLQFQAGFASGGNEMFAVGEWVGGAAALDGWTGAVQNRAGTFDFSLRGALFNMANNNGFYDMSQIINSQQNIRFIDIGGKRIHRTVPFVNNHDTFRPCVDSDGNYTNVWGGDACGNGNELAEHISPENWRMPLAYAVAFAVDGNPQIFLEDLFDMNRSNRFNHDPKSNTTLPVNDWLEKLIWCHQNLGFEDGDYSTPTTEGSTFFPSGNSNQDLLIIERNDKAFIALNDNGANSQGAWVDTNWPIGTELVDYTGQISSSVMVQPPFGGGPNRVFIEAPAVGNLTSGQHGFAVWAPAGIGSTYNNAPILTVQEWEMANDLGDIHCQSLTQGGALPAASMDYRIAGKIFPEAGQNVMYELFTEQAAQLVHLEFYDLDGNLIHSDNGTGNFSGSFMAPNTEWLVAKMKHGDWTGSITCPNTNSGTPPVEQRAYLKLSYHAPASISSANDFPSVSRVSFWTGAAGDNDWANCQNWEEGIVPSASSKVFIPSGAVVNISTNVDADEMHIACGATVMADCDVAFNITGDWSNEGTFNGGILNMLGSMEQNISGNNTVCTLNIANSQDVVLMNDLVVLDELQFTNGILKTGSYTVFVSNDAADAISGESSSSYLIGTIRRAVASGNIYNFPLGDESEGYNPASINFTNVGDASQLTATFVYGNTQSIPANRICDINNDSSPDNVLYNCVFGGWNVSSDGTNGMEYTITLSPSNSLSGICTDNVTIGKDGVFACNEGLSKTFNSFSDFDVVGVEATATPVSWLSFEGELNNDDAKLKWSTATEQNNDRFEVEKSVDGSDFETIARVSSQGDSETPQYYDYLDQSFAGAAYYRLKQVDLDGSHSYSPIVRLQAELNKNRFQLFPNPFTEEVVINVDEKEKGKMVNAILYSVDGKMLAQWQLQELSRLNELLNQELKLQLPGVYRLVFTGQAYQESHLLVKQ